MTASSIRTDFDAEFDTANPLPEHHLTVTLRDYQRQTVRWMLDQENTPCSVNRPLYATGEYTSGERFHWCPFDYALKSSLPETRGGWVCEEMGLVRLLPLLFFASLTSPP